MSGPPPFTSQWSWPRRSLWHYRPTRWLSGLVLGVLCALFTGQRDSLRAALEAALAGLDAEAARKGVQVGAAAAREVLERRRFDGWARAAPQYVLSDRPGNWQPTPPANAPAGFTHYPDAEPFVIGSAQSYLVEPPPYPSYPGNMACITGAGVRLLARFFGRDDVAFSVTWAQVDGPGWTRQYSRFGQLADEAARSRIYGGIHYTFDSLASVGVCIPLADYAFDNNLRARFR